MSRDTQVFIVAVAVVLVLLVGMGYGASVGTRRAYRQFITGQATVITYAVPGAGTCRAVLVDGQRHGETCEGRGGMSGGSYDYFTFKLEGFAEAVRRKVPLDASEAVRAARLAFADHMERAALGAHAIEWVDSGDWASGDELAALNAYLQGFTPAMADAALTALAARLRDLAGALEAERGAVPEAQP